MAVVNETAFIVRDDAHARYNRSDESPVRITPPYGSVVEVLNRDGDWARIRAFSKDAWIRADCLSEHAPPERKRFVPQFGVSYADIPGSSTTYPSEIEYGPRGGRFTRTRSGFRRYF